MWNKQAFEEMDENEYIFGKLTNDGGYNNLFFKEQHLPRRKKAYKPVEERVEVELSALAIAKEKRQENVPISNADKQSGKDLHKETFAQGAANKTVRMSLKELFDFYYNAYEKEKWNARWSKMMNHFREYIPDEKRRREFLKENFKRKRHNEKARKRRMDRKMSMNGFNYFVTFTYSDEKMSEEQFKKKLKAYLRNNVNRYGWKYIGVWEGLDGSVRLHFHALMYIPDEVLPGENCIETKYNPVTKQMETHTRNTEFNEKFGLSTIEEIIPEIRYRAYDYITKYMNKGGKMMMSRNCPTFIKCAIQKKELLGCVNDEGTYFVAAADVEIVMETGEVVRLEPYKVHEILPKATTCN